MKERYYIFSAVLFIVFINVEMTSATITSDNPANFGSVSYIGSNFYLLESTNSDNKPYLGGISIFNHNYSSGQTNIPYSQQAIVELNINSMIVAPHYYLELSPWSAWAGASISSNVSLYSYQGDGIVTENDFNKGSFVSSTLITNPNEQVNSWYTSNSFGGYIGDSYVDITSIIEYAQDNHINYLGLDVRDDDAPNSGVLFRAPRILSSDDVIVSQFAHADTPVPEPATLLLFGAGIAGLAAVGRRKRS